MFVLAGNGDTIIDYIMTYDDWGTDWRRFWEKRDPWWDAWRNHVTSSETFKLKKLLKFWRKTGCSVAYNLFEVSLLLRKDSYSFFICVISVNVHNPFLHTISDWISYSLTCPSWSRLLNKLIDEKYPTKRHEYFFSFFFLIVCKYFSSKRKSNEKTICILFCPPIGKR